jgi:hypothetical protein
MQPTATTYSELQVAYDAFNTGLFEGQLPQCLLTLQREKRTYGYFSARRFGTRAGQTTDEIALNPEYFAVVPLVEVLQTVVHEMTHLWQSHFGQPGRGRYHNAEWADKMEAIGLMPSSTGAPGGRRVGDIMADYVIPNGRFAEVVDELMRDKRIGITWFDRFTPPAPLYPVAATFSVAGVPAAAFEVPKDQGVSIMPKVAAATAADRSNRVKYSCPKCSLNVWGKPAIRVGCLACDLELQAAAVGDGLDETAVGRAAMASARRSTAPPRTRRIAPSN